MEYTDSYYSGNSKNTGLGRKEVLYMGNFCAFQFWQRALKVSCAHFCALLDHDIFKLVSVTGLRMPLYRTSAGLNDSKTPLSLMRQKIWKFCFQRSRKNGAYFTTLSCLPSSKLLNHV